MTAIRPGASPESVAAVAGDLSSHTTATADAHAIGAVTGLTDALAARGYNVKAYGATGDGTTDDTDAIQSAIDAAAMAKASVLFPAGTYIITTPLVVRRSGTRFIGDNRVHSIIQQIGTGDAFTVTTDTYGDTDWGSEDEAIGVVFTDLRIIGPGVATSLGCGISLDGAGSQTSSFATVDRCMIEAFAYGIKDDHCDNTVISKCYIETCGTGVYITGNANTVQLIGTNISGCTTVGLYITGSCGVTVNGGDFGNQPRCIQTATTPTVTMTGGNFETCIGGTEFVYVDTNSHFIHFGGRFLKGTGADVPGYRVAGAGRLTFGGCQMADFVTTDYIAQKAAAAAYITALPGDLGTASSLYLIDANGEKYRMSPFDSIADNAVGNGSAPLRGWTALVTSRAAALTEDRLVHHVRLRDGTYEAVDLFNTRHRYATNGTAHARVPQMRQNTGRIDVTSAAAAYTDVTVNVDAFTTYLSATATVLASTGIAAYATVFSLNTGTGNFVFRVHHPGDTGGSIPMKLFYSISVAY